MNDLSCIAIFFAFQPNNATKRLPVEGDIIRVGRKRFEVEWVEAIIPNQEGFCWPSILISANSVSRKKRKQ